MRFYEILKELAMNPTGLAKQAKTLDAYCGIEFEMILVDEARSDSTDLDMRPDTIPRSINDIIAFFSANDINSEQEIESLDNKLNQNYTQWFEKLLANRWDDEQLEVIQDSYPNIKTVDSNSREYKIVYRDYRTEYFDDYYEQFQKIWLNNRYLSSFVDEYQIKWPFTVPGSGRIDIKSVADEFSQVVNYDTKISYSYHNMERGDYFIIEKDDSIRPDDKTDMIEEGWEFISPALRLDHMITLLEKIINWARSKEYYTNKSCGLHMNVSIPNYSLDKLDYIKLAVFSGDNFLLKKFERIGNQYAQSALDKIDLNIKINPNMGAILLARMQSDLSNVVHKLIHDGNTSHETSINTKPDYIEFRQPGGNWLDIDVDDLKNTLYRYVVALDVACDPEKYKKEYAVKLYKLINPENDTYDTIKYFSKYTSGLMSKAALKSFVKQTARNRQTGTRDYRVGINTNAKIHTEHMMSNNPYYQDVVATSRRDAIDKARIKWGLKYSRGNVPNDDDFTVEILRT